MKRRLSALLFVLVLLSSCKTQVTLYENFLNDMDFEYRFEQLCERVDAGDKDALLVMNMSTFRNELAGYTDEKEQINDINDMFVLGVDMLIAQTEKEEGDSAEAMQVYRGALKLWGEYKSQNNGGNLEEF